MWGRVLSRVPSEPPQSSPGAGDGGGGSAGLEPGASGVGLRVLADVRVGAARVRLEPANRALRVPKPLRWGTVLDNFGGDDAAAYYADLCFVKPPLVRGPYRIMRHPNYLAVAGELAGVALIVLAVVVPEQPV